MFGTVRSASSTRSHARPARRIGGIVAAAALGASLTLAAPLAASAETQPVVSVVSHAEGQFLSGNLIGVDLDVVAAIRAAIAKNNGSQLLQISRDG